MKKIISVLTLGLTFSINVVASNTLTSFFNNVSDIFATNIYCPQKIYDTNSGFYGAPPNFNSGRLFGSLLKHETIALYFGGAISIRANFGNNPLYSRFHFNTNNACLYKSKNQKISLLITSQTPLEANTEAIKNSWGKLDLDGNLVCSYNAAHCPFEAS